MDAIRRFLIVELDHWDKDDSQDEEVDCGLITIELPDELSQAVATGKVKKHIYYNSWTLELVVHFKYEPDPVETRRGTPPMFIGG